MGQATFSYILTYCSNVCCLLMAVQDGHHGMRNIQLYSHLLLKCLLPADGCPGWQPPEGQHSAVFPPTAEICIAY
jgi:hypothetical protein